MANFNDITAVNAWAQGSPKLLPVHPRSSPPSTAPKPPPPLALSSPNSLPCQRARSPQALDPSSLPTKRRTFEPWRESIGEAVALDDNMRTGWDAREMRQANQNKMKYVSTFNELEFTALFSR